MILFLKIVLDQVAEFGKEFNWGSHFCEGCQRDMWGHGYVQRYFSGYRDPIFLKRYRCPNCFKVVTVRPDTYFESVRSSISTIYESLKAKLEGFWPPWCSRQRGGHWLRRFISFAKMEMQSDLVSFLDHCFLNLIKFLPKLI